MHLLVKVNKKIAKTLDLNENPVLLIGRDKSCGLELQDPQVSRLHAKLIYQHGKVTLEDCGSRHGVLVNNIRLERKQIVTPSDSIVIGSCELKLIDEDENDIDSVLDAEEKLLTTDDFEYSSILYTERTMDLKKRIHEAVLREMNVSNIRMEDVKKSSFREELERTLQRVMLDYWHELPIGLPQNVFKEALMDDLIGFGPISSLIRSEDIDEIMVNGAERVSIERKGLIYRTGIRFFNERHLVSIIQRIVEMVGRHIDEVSPMVDARLSDGSRVNAVIAPVSLDGASLTIRKFAKQRLTTKELMEYGSLSDKMARFLSEAVKARQSILVTGGTGTGKTTLLNVLSNFIPVNERLVTIEDSAELRLNHWNLVRLESRMANVEGKGRISIRELVINSLRMRPDRIIVGECRGGEAWDMLQAMNTGHEGSLTTIHANSPRDALSRLENMVMMAGFDLPVTAIREQIASSLDIVVHLSRMPDGSRKITKIAEITGRDSNVITMQDIFVFRQGALDANGRVTGDYVATGNIPTFVTQLNASGIRRFDMGMFENPDTELQQLRSE